VKWLLLDLQVYQQKRENGGETVTALENFLSSKAPERTARHFEQMV